LINDMLDLASFEAGIFALNRNPLDVPAWLANQISLAQPTAMQKSVRLILNMDEELGNIQADAQRLRQAFYNLLNHAIKGTPDGGTVSLKAGLTDQQDTAYLEILLQDGAKGALMQDQEQAYKTAWEQSTPATTRRNTGGGDIGLSLAKTIIEAHGGQLQLSGDPAVGVTVRCLLPIAGT
jgi:signal transduction histidine kinase